MVWALLFVSGGMGGLARWLLTRWVDRGGKGVIPWGTVVVNGLGCLVLGWLIGEGTVKQVSGAEWGVWILLGVGFTGGFTTVSTMAMQTTLLAQREGVSRWPALGYFLANSVSGVGGLLAGWGLAHL